MFEKRSGFYWPTLYMASSSAPSVRTVVISIMELDGNVINDVRQAHRTQPSHLIDQTMEPKAF
jgi:hypothetical protein